MSNLFLHLSTYLSLPLAVYSIVITKIYNNQSKKIQEDRVLWERELNRRDNNYIFALRQINDKVDFIKNGYKNNAYLNKDTIIFIKTSRYNPCEAHKVIEIVNELEILIKYKFLEDIQYFLHALEGNKKEINVRRRLNMDDIKYIIKISEELSKYGIQICIHYI